MFIIVCIIVSVIPISLFIMSVNYFRKKESNFNDYILYATKRSMLSQEAKEYGRRFIARLWCIITPLMLSESIYLLFKYKAFYKIVAVYLIVFQISLVWFTVIPVEFRLKRKFDKDGNFINSRKNIKS